MQRKANCTEARTHYVAYLSGNIQRGSEGVLKQA